jgi:hypothetical protein
MENKERGAFGRGRGRGGDRGRGGPRGRGGRGGREEDKEWVPVTKLGRLVKDGKIKSVRCLVDLFCFFVFWVQNHDVVICAVLSVQNHASYRDFVPRIVMRMHFRKCRMICMITLHILIFCISITPFPIYYCWAKSHCQIEEIYLFSLPIKEFQVVDFFLPKLKDECMKIMPVQKQTRAGQRTRFKAFVAVGDFNGHVGLGVKCSKEVAIAIRGAIILAKLACVPVRRGYWGAFFLFLLLLAFF